MRLLGAAFPRASWSDDTEAVYVMAMAQVGVTPRQARAAVRKLICESHELPTVAAVLGTVRSMVAGELLAEWRCPECGSDKVAGVIDGPATCFDCDWDGVLQSAPHHPAVPADAERMVRKGGMRPLSEALPPGFAQPREPAKAFEPKESGAA